jgi:RNA-directed DNA polymerase
MIAIPQTAAVVDLTPMPDLPAGSVEFQAQLYQATRSAGRPVGGLMPWLLDRRCLAAAWERVRDAGGADTPGPDGLTCAALAQRAGSWLAGLADDLFHGRYQPRPPRWVEVPKPDRPGAVRRIGILNVRDRVVQAALKHLLEPILEPVFLPGSFGFRPGRSTAGAVATAARLLGAPAGGAPTLLWGVPLDVADCFPTVDHALLLAEVGRHVADPPLLRLIEQCVRAGGESVGRLWWRRTCGLVQGSPLSPLLCNLALHSVDLALERLGRDTQGGVAALRYADDLLLLARDARLAERGVAAARAALRERHQGLGGDPGPRPAADGIDWLGVRLQPRRLALPGRVEFGHVVPESKLAAMLARLTEMTTPPSDKIDASAFNPARWIVSINDQLRDWRQVYCFADNAPDLFRVLDDFARERVGALLQALTGTRGPELYRKYRVRLPRGFSTWEVPGARLTVLSSLAPCAPVQLTRRPAWMCHRPGGRGASGAWSPGFRRSGGEDRLKAELQPPEAGVPPSGGNAEDRLKAELQPPAADRPQEKLQPGAPPALEYKEDR